jgi:predicted methyltransferase
VKALAVAATVNEPWIADLAGRALAECSNVKEIPMYDQSKLSELIRFARVDAGSTVIDVYPGDGDWTRLFSDVVGPQGRVFSFVPAEVAHFKNDPVGGMQTLAKEPGRENVEAVSADLVAMPKATQPADVLWLHLFYHDLHTKLIQARGATAAHFNRAVYERLKPGGSYVIVDHAAAAGAGTSNAQSLHRRPSERRWRRRASCSMRKAPFSRTRTISTRSRCSTLRSRARRIASPIGL